MNIKNLKEKIFLLTKENIWLLLILTVAFSVRYYGIHFDYPFGTNFIWDEIFSVVYMFDVLQTKNIFIGTYQYPLLLPLLYFPGLLLRLVYLALINGIYSLNKLKELLIVGGIDQAYIIVRMYSAVFGTATIYLLYKIYHLILKNRASAYYAALACSISLAPVYISHWGKTHSIMVFFIIASLYAAIKYESTKQNKYFYYCSLLSACAFAIHYIGASAAILPFYLYVTHWREINLKKLFYGVLIYLGIIGTFYGANIAGLKGMLANNLWYFKTSGTIGMFHVGFWERFYYIPLNSFNVEPVFITLFFFGLIYNFSSLIKDKLIRYVLVILGFNYLFTITIVAWPEVIRWQMTFITITVSLGAALFFELLQKKISNRQVLYGLAGLLLLPSLLITIKWLSLLNSNTMLDASSWLQNNLKKDEIAYSFDRYLEAPLSYGAVKFQVKNNNHTSKKAEFVLNNPEEFKNFGINLYYDYENLRYQELAGEKTKYIITSYWGFEKGVYYREYTDKFLEGVKKYHQIKLVKNFYPTKINLPLQKEEGDFDVLNNPTSWQLLFKLKSSGPFIEIYELTK